MVILEILIILKIPPWDFHMVRERNISSVVVSRKNPVEIRACLMLEINY